MRSLTAFKMVGAILPVLSNAEGRIARARIGTFASTSLVIITSFFLTSCNPKIEVYEIPKEDYSKTKKLASTPIEAQPISIKWKAPSHWITQEASGMRQGSFLVKKGENSADISITSFPGDTGSQLANVNRWRGQLELPPLSEQELPKPWYIFKVQERSILVWDIVSKKPLKDQKTMTRMLIASLKETDRTWFFKMMGDDKLVQSERDAFIAFLKELQFGEVTSKTVEANPPPELKKNVVSWKAPPSWKEVPAAGIRRASFQFSGKNSQSGEVSIVVLQGTGGGTLANINLWREQLKLEPLMESDFEKNVRNLKVNGKAATLIDFVSALPITEQKQKNRIIAAIIPLADETWFIKMTGEDSSVKDQKAIFLKFLESIRFSESK